jgi:hypothetical protein
MVFQLLSYAFVQNLGYNPNKEYKGVILKNCSGKCDIFASNVQQSGNLDFQYENNSLQKDFENITIELTPYK